MIAIPGDTSRSAIAAMMERRTEESIAAFRRALNLNPNSAAAHAHLSHGLAFAGQDREAIEHARRRHPAQSARSR